MLTTSLKPDDVEKAKQIPEIVGLQHKPLSVGMINEIIEEYFQG